MPQWQNKGYEKPKFHPAEHLAAALDEFGPFRAFWCMPWESYLQILKRMFDMCNWISAPWTVATHWATKSVMHYTAIPHAGRGIRMRWCPNPTGRAMCLLWHAALSWSALFFSLARPCSQFE